jgi:hypothetical protein
MGIWSSKACTLGGVLCAVAWSGANCPTAWAGGYLACTGPVPLRFAVEKPAAAPYELPPLAMNDPLPAPEPSGLATPSFASQTGMEDTNAVVAEIIGPVATPSEEALASFDTDPLSIPQSQPVAPVPPEMTPGRAASDLLVVTTQMLAEYFKTGRPTTNAASAVLFAPVEFMPPAPLGGAAPSSRATYRTQ